MAPLTWFRQLDAMVDSAAFLVLAAEAVAQAPFAMATTRDDAGGSSASVQILDHHARLEKLVPEDWREWQCQFGVATHAYSSKHGALWEIVERMELDEVSSETLKHQMSQEELEWMGENAVRDV